MPVRRAGGFTDAPAIEPRQAAVVSSKNGGDMAPELDQEFDPGTLHALRAKVLAQACRAGLSESRATDVVLAVHELAVNVAATPTNLTASSEARRPSDLSM